MKINFDWKLFNPLYWHLKEAMKDPNIRFIFIMGGSSAAKSYSVGQALITDSLETGHNHLCMRKISAHLDDTIYADMEVIGKSINKHTHNFKFIQKRIDIGAAKLQFRGLDKSEKIQGISKFIKAYMDEITHFVPDDYMQMRKRLRGKVGQQIISSWNPISINHWINKQVLKEEEWKDLPLKLPGNSHSKLYSGDKPEENSFKKINKRGNMLLFKTTYRDNWWIVGHPAGKGYGYYDKHVIEDFEYDKVHNPVNYDIYANGNWGIVTERLIMRPGEWSIVDEIPEGFKQIPSGLDFGFEGDPTAVVDFYVKDNYLLWDQRIYKRGLTNIKQLDSEGEVIGNSIQSELEDIEFLQDQLIIAECAEPKSITEIRNCGQNIFAVKKRKVLEGIKMLKSYQHLITKRSSNVIYEFENYMKQMDKDGNILDDPIDKDNHAFDLARYVQFMKGSLWDI